MDNNLGQVVLVKDIDPSFSDSRNSPYYSFLPSFPESSSPSNFIEFNNKLYFAASNNRDDGFRGSIIKKLFVSDGTTEGTQLLGDNITLNSSRSGLGGSDYSSRLSGFIEFNDKLYFAANGAGTGIELFVSDGTAEGTQLLVDLRSSRLASPPFSRLSGSRPNDFIEFNDKLYFAANNGENGREVFVSDGTSEGTQLLADINPNSFDPPYDDFGSSSFPYNFIEFNDRLYFAANDGENGSELFVSNGTADGTQLLVDLRPGLNQDGYNYGSNPDNFIEFNDKLYFIADNGENGRELFVSDGTSEGTQLVADINPGSGSSFPERSPGRNFVERYYVESYFIEFNDRLYFTADNGENGTELFVTDGTAEGTQLVADINPGSFGSNPDNFVEFNGKLYFAANKGENGTELFVTDGTAEGTQLVADINPGSGNSNPDNFIEFNNKLYFTADDGENGTELFVTDGTAEGTVIVADINPGSDYGFGSSSSPSDLTVVGDELFFAASDDEVGRELFKLTFDDTVVTQTQPLNPSSGTANDDRLLGTDSGDEITGESTNDGITGGAGNDTINGLSGNDAIDGGAGNDVIDGGEGTDTAVYQFAPGAVTVSLGEGSDLVMAMDGYGTTDSLSNIENIIGSEEDDDLTGNSGSNSLTGRGGLDTISGLGGDDFLTGSGGADTISGGEGSDRFVYLNPGEGGDTITDFAVGVDKIAVVSAGFGGGLPVGELPPSQFSLGSSATSSQQFIFDDASGELFFDADGNGVVDAELIATLGGVSNLSAGDIMLL